MTKAVPNKAEATPWKRALVTGASSGLGSEFCSQLAEEGTHLVLVARNAQRLNDLATSLSEKYQVSCEVLPADLATSEGVTLVTQRLAEDPRPIDMLVNNAGLGYTGDAITIPPDRHLEQISVNVTALTCLSHWGAEAMERRGGGTILNVSSIAGDVPGPSSAVYNATKAFVTSFSQALHIEMRDRGVVVSCLCPGPVRTEFQDRGGYETSEIPSLLWQEPAAVVAIGLQAARDHEAIVTSRAMNKVWSRLIRTMPPTFSSAAAHLLKPK